MEIREIASDRLIYNMSVSPHGTYCEAMRRTNVLMDNPNNWTAKRVGRTEAELASLKKIVRAYYART